MKTMKLTIRLAGMYKQLFKFHLGVEKFFLFYFILFIYLFIYLFFFFFCKKKTILCYDQLDS
jgi:amino acid permease